MKKTVEIDSPKEFDTLSPERQELLLGWIEENLSPIKTFNSYYTSYGLKHLVERDIDGDGYFTNGEFKGAMLKSGYKVKDEAEQNWIFNISQKSPALSKK